MWFCNLLKRRRTLRTCKTDEYTLKAYTNFFRKRLRFQDEKTISETAFQILKTLFAFALAHKTDFSIRCYHPYTLYNGQLCDVINQN